MKASLQYTGLRPTGQDATLRDEDHLALAAACAPGTGLCTIVGIEGSFSRSIGAQLAIRADGSIAGRLSDGCLEQQLARDCAEASAPVVHRYGKGSQVIDFRLPCGAGLDILVDPEPDRKACLSVLDALQRRQAATLTLPGDGKLKRRVYLPPLAVTAYGDGPELAAFAAIGRAAGIAVEVINKGTLSIGRPSGHAMADEWTAVVMLFHDHEWEIALLEEALAGRAFYIGAQGGAQARLQRLEELRRRGAVQSALARIRSPVGTPRGSRTPQTLALAALAEITSEYERLRPGA